jgi:serine/threonine protein kinase
LEEESPLTNRIGTPAWTALKKFSGLPDTAKVDVSSIAIILFELASDFGFRGLKPNEIINAIARRE